MTPPSLTARISLLFACCAAVVLLGLGWIVLRSVEAHFLELDRQEIEGKRSLVGNMLARIDDPAELDALPQQLDDALVGHHGLSVALITGDGSVWYASPGQTSPDIPPGNDGRLTIWSKDGRTWRGLTAPVAAGFTGAPRYTVAIALDITHHQRFMGEFLNLLGLATALATLLTAALGWLATRAGLLPLRRMTALATRLSASQLHERLPESRLPTEIRSLSTAFNAMLTRLEDGFRRLSEFSSDIAHELRTPVSNLMTQTQVALSRERTAEVYRDVLQSNLEEYDRLARMIADMLFLAQADNRQLVPKRERVDLAGEAASLLEFHGILADDRGIRLQVIGEATVEGDRLMLRRALSNLLSNAIHHCPPGEVVTIRLADDADGATLGVENPGVIPAENLARLFDRFYTGAPSRQPGGEGVGLGLAIVKSIVDAHGGEITAHSDEGLIRLVARLPTTLAEA